MNPIVDVQLAAPANLTFKNVAVEAGVAPAPAEYVVQWLRFDNATGATTPIGATRATGTSVAAPPDLPSAAGGYIRAEGWTRKLGFPRARLLCARGWRLEARWLRAYAGRQSAARRRRDEAHGELIGRSYRPRARNAFASASSGRSMSA